MEASSPYIDFPFNFSSVVILQFMLHSFIFKNITFQHLCSTSETIQILDDEDVDITTIIEETLLGMQKPVKSRVKREVLKERVKEQLSQIRVVQRVQATPEFLDPYAEVGCSMCLFCL